MVVPEVSQISMKNWTPALHKPATDDLFLELYVASKTGPCRCCARKTRKRCAERLRTYRLREAKEMLWRKFNEDNFLIALFSLDGSPWRAFRHGQEVTVAVDAIRLPRSADPEETGELAKTFEGKLQFGVWGAFKLRSADAASVADEGEIPEVILELRPKTMRPFYLEYARPQNAPLESATDTLGRQNRLSAVSEESCHSSSHSTAGGRLSCPQRHPMPLSPRSSADSRGERLLQRRPLITDSVEMSWCEHHSDSARKVPSGLVALSASDSYKVTSNTLSASNSYKGSDGLLRSVSDDGNDLNRVSKVDSLEGTWSRLLGSGGAYMRCKRDKMATQLQRLVRKQLKNMVETRQRMQPKDYNEWTPQEWEAFWKSCWPGDQDTLSKGHDVVPLMEAEFRKDCVIFYNTLFPRPQSEMFGVLRALAFEPGASKVSFKLLSERRQDTAPLPLTWSLETGTLGGSAESVRERSSDETRFGRGLRLRAAKLLLPRFSRPNSPSPTSPSPTSGSSRSPRRLFWTGSFEMDGKVPSVMRIPSKANPSIGSRSAETDPGVAEETARSDNSCESGTESEVDGGEFGRPVTPPPMVKLCSQESLRPLAPMTKLSSQELPMLHQQPCMCTITMPKGVFVDDYSPRIMFLKRLLLCFAVCGVHYSEVANCSHLAELWPYPLAAVLGHGSRVLIRLEDIEASEFVNFLMFGDPGCVDWKENGLPYPLVRRLAATHSVQLETDTGNLVERKLHVMSAADTMQNISDGIRRKHLALNLPIGGAGNPAPCGKRCYIDFMGRIVQKTSTPPAGDRWRLLQLSRSSLDFASTTPYPKEGGFLQRTALRKSEESAARASAEAAEIGSTTGRSLTPEDPEQVNRIGSLLGSDCSEGLTQRPSYEVEGESLGHASTSPDTMSPIVSAQLAQARYRLVPNIQGGHLYIRIDDFGEQMSRCSQSEANTVGSKRWEIKQSLLKRPMGYNAALEQAKLQARFQFTCHGAGEVFFSSRVPEIRSKKSSGLQRDFVGDMTLLRMASEPSLMASEVSFEDIAWAKETILTKSRSPLRPPPTPHALRQVLEHFDPINTQLFGRGGFSSLEDLCRELRSNRSWLLKRGQSILRYVEPVVLQLRWRGHLLMLTHQQLSQVGEDGTTTQRTVPKSSFVCARLIPDGPGDDWREVLHVMLHNEFHVLTNDLYDHLHPDAQDDAKCHTVLEEMMPSPSYPGLFSCYRVHQVKWNIREESTDYFRTLGLPIDTASRNARPNHCDFQTMAQGRRTRTRYWRWVPERAALRNQRFLNMDTRTADDRWALYAFESEGVVQFPPTVEALTILLLRCSIDISVFGQGPHKSLEALWLELLNQESYLVMSAGQPQRIMETLFVKIRWRHPRTARQGSKSTLPNPSSLGGTEGWQVLVKKIENGKSESTTKTPSQVWRLPPTLESAQSADPEAQRQLHRQDTENGILYTLLSTKKYREETWHEGMTRCVTKELALTNQQLKGLCDPRTTDEGRYAFQDLIRPSVSFPGISTLYRTHLTTMTFKEDFEHTPAFQQAEESTICRLPPPLKESSRRVLMTPSCPTPLIATSSSGDHGGCRVCFLWIWEDGSGGLPVEQVRGLELWAEAKKHEARRKVSSVLVGLEGSPPSRKSPFGQEHDASGTSAKVSATGGRKWRAYRKNNALQIPSDVGGMHVKITRTMFQEFMDTCDVLGLVDPSMDLADEKPRYTREDLERRHAEKELFKQVLAGSGRQAKQSVELMKEYASTRRTPTQAYIAISRGASSQERAASSQDQDNCVGNERVTVVGVNTDVVRL